ncbi:hypothetical protein J6590_098605, partial [Homalodisca vitripennis]
MVIKYATFGGTSLVVVLILLFFADLLRAGLRDSRQYPQAAQTESPLQTLEETVHTVLDQMLIKARSIETRVGV